MGGWVSGCVCVCVYVCVCVCTALSPHLRGRFYPGGAHFFLFFYSEFGKKIIFYDSPIRFCFMSNFRFSKYLFLIFLNDE